MLQPIILEIILEYLGELENFNQPHGGNSGACLFRVAIVLGASLILVIPIFELHVDLDHLRDEGTP